MKTKIIRQQLSTNVLQATTKVRDDVHGMPDNVVFVSARTMSALLENSSNPPKLSNSVINIFKRASAS